MQVLSEQSFVQLNKGVTLEAGDTLDVELDVTEHHPKASSATFGATGTLMKGHEVVGAVAGEWTEGFTHHPVVSLMDALEKADAQEVPTARLTLGKAKGRTPVP